MEAIRRTRIHPYTSYLHGCRYVDCPHCCLWFSHLHMAFAPGNRPHFGTPPTRSFRSTSHWECATCTKGVSMAHLCQVGIHLGYTLFVIVSFMHNIDCLHGTGDIVHIRVFGQPIIILSSLEAAHEIFEKHSSNFSDRLFTPMLELYVNILPLMFRADDVLSGELGWTGILPHCPMAMHGGNVVAHSISIFAKGLSTSTGRF